jgi:hypothetical protein
MTMFNLELFSLYIIYLATLLIGFKIKKKQKDVHNLKYHKYKPTLYTLIAFIHIINIFLLLEAMRFNEQLFSILIVAQILFSGYFFILTIDKTRCWKQHRMIIFNFLLIFEIYYIAQLSLSLLPYILLLLINVYNILEFQFAKFNFKSPLIWD